MNTIAITFYDAFLQNYVMKRKKVTNELIASFLYSSRQLTASNV